MIQCLHLCLRLASRMATPPSDHLSCRSCIGTNLYGLPRLYRNMLLTIVYPLIHLYKAA